MRRSVAVELVERFVHVDDPASVPSERGFRSAPIAAGSRSCRSSVLSVAFGPLNSVPQHRRDARSGPRTLRRTSRMTERRSRGLGPHHRPGRSGWSRWRRRRSPEARRRCAVRSAGMSRGAPSGWIAHPATAISNASSTDGAPSDEVVRRHSSSSSPAARSRNGRPVSPSARSSTHTRPPCMRTCSSTSERPRPAPSLPVRRPATAAAGEAFEHEIAFLRWARQDRDPRRRSARG